MFTRGNHESLAALDKQIYRLLGKATTLAAMAYRVRQGRDFVTPPTGLSYAGSYVHSFPAVGIILTGCFFRFLYQLDYQGQADYRPNPVLEKALDVLFLLHADHELNASWCVLPRLGDV